MAFIPFTSYLMDQKRGPYFQEVGGMVTKNISVICMVSCVILQRNAEFSKIL